MATEERELHEAESEYAAYETKLNSDCRKFYAQHGEDFIKEVQEGTNNSFEAFLESIDDPIDEIVDSADDLTWHDVAEIFEFTEYEAPKVTTSDPFAEVKEAARYCYKKDLATTIKAHMKNVLSGLLESAQKRTKELRQEEEGLYKIVNGDSVEANQEAHDRLDTVSDEIFKLDAHMLEYHAAIVKLS